METRTIQVNFPDNKVMDIEIAVYENALITLHNDKIYQGGNFNNHIFANDKINELKNNLVSYHPLTSYCSNQDKFIIMVECKYENLGQTIKLKYNPDENDEIGSFIRANGLFGTSNEYVLK